MTATGIVLAGGRSSRFGEGASKLAADLGGRTVLDRTIDAVVLTCEDVVVIGAATGERSDVRHLADAAPFEGPLAALAPALTALAATGGDVVVVVGGDMPFVSPDVLRLLVARVAGRTTAAVLDGGSRPRSLPMAVRREVAAVAAAEALLADERSLRALLGRLAVLVVPEAVWRALDPDGSTLLDIDTPADLERARARLTARR